MLQLQSKFCLLGLSIQLVVLPVTAADSNLSDGNNANLETLPLPQQTTELRGQTEALQWVSESVTVIKKADIEATHRQDLSDLSSYVPGMVIDRSGYSAQGASISIRGIQSNGFTIEPAVAVSVDGVYIGTHASQNQILFDFEQIEIARGPQAAFIGVPSAAGSINMRRTKPTGINGLVTHAGFGQDQRTFADFVANFPINKVLAGKISGRFLNGSNIGINNSFSERDENNDDLTALSFSVLLHGIGNITAQYTFDFEQDDSDSPALVNLSSDITPDLVCIPNPITAPDIRANCGQGGQIPEIGRNNTLQNFSNSRRYDGNHHTLRLEGNWDDVKISSITGLRSTELDSDRDNDATSPDRFSSILREGYDQFSTELKLSRQINEDLFVMLGGLWLDYKSNLKRDDFFVLDTLTTANRVSASSGQISRINSKQDNSIKSVFLYIDQTLNKTWQTDLNLRLNRFEKKFKHSLTGVNPDLLIDEEMSWDEVAGSVGISYRVPEEDAMVYARYSTNITPGGFYNRATSKDSSAYNKSIRTQGYELGMKSEFIANHLRINMVYFRNFQSNTVEATNILRSNNNIESALANIAEIDVRGYEFEFEYTPIENLYFRGTYGHQNANYESFNIQDLNPALPEGYVSGDPKPVINIDRSGIFTPRRSPSDTLSLNSQYSIPFGHGNIKLYTGFHRVSEYQTDPRNPAAKVSLQSKWDASIAYEWNNFSFRIFSQNLTDQRYLINYRTTLDTEIASIPSQVKAQGIVSSAEVNRPRFTGFELSWTPKFK